GLYSLHISIEELPEDTIFMISPLLSHREQPLRTETHFENLRLLELGRFYKIKAMQGDVEVNRVIKIRTDGIPQERENEIYRAIIKDSHTFLKYVAFLLADDFLMTAL